MRPKMKVTSTVVEVDNVKEYFCFVCNARSTEKGLPLLLSETTFSHICLGQKLQEILGKKFIVLITAKDTICWDCAEEINWVDKYEIKLDIAKENILNQISKKYRKIEMCLEKEGSSNPIQKGSDYYEDKNVDDIDQILIEQDLPYSPPTSNSTPVKKKKFPCSVCHKLYATAAAAGAHMAKVHRFHFNCELCNKTFSTDKKLKAHLDTHSMSEVVTGSKLCVTCGFQTKNTEVYCRHVCNSAIMSLTCTTCKKRYVDSNFSKEGNMGFQCQSCKKLNPINEVLIEEQPVTDISTQPVFEISKVSAETLHSEMPEFFKPPQSKDTQEQVGILIQNIRSDEIELETEPVNEGTLMEITEDTTGQAQCELTIEGNVIENMMVSVKGRGESDKKSLMKSQISYLKCTNCNEEFELSQLASHQCFVREDVIEYSEVERSTGPQYISVPIFKNGSGEEITSGEAIITHSPKVHHRRRIPRIPALENSYFNLNDNATQMHCKTCGAEFKTIGLMRQHWDLTGHTREVSTTTIELNKIKDKTRKTEKTFKVVKQNFNIRAYVLGQNDEEMKKSDDVQLDCIVKVKEGMKIEDFMKMNDGRECETCGIIFGGEKLLKEHYKIDCLTCVTCNVTFLDNRLLKKHYDCTGHANKVLPKTEPANAVKEEIEPQVYRCDICSKSLSSRYVLNKHIQRHYKGTSKGACCYCQMEFEDKSQIQQHVLENHGAQLYECEHCDKTFLSEIIRNKHQSKHAEYQCKFCKIKFMTQKLLLSHMDQQHRAMCCCVCGKFIINLQALKVHEKRHFYGHELKCDLCDKSFATKALLQSHNRLHPSEVQFQCKPCNLSFKSSLSLENHEIMHVKKDYNCPKCSVVCPSRMYFWMHMKRHDTTYVCSVCGRMFRDTSLLAIHRRKHRVRPYQCPHCPRSFSVPATLKRHLTVHRRAYPHRCELCKKGFLTKSAFHKHLDTEHSISQMQPNKLDRKIPSLPLNATDEDLFQAADTLIADDTIMFNDYDHKDGVEQVSSSDLITNEVIVETTELFDEILT